MKKIFKNLDYIIVMSALFVALVSLITFFFVKSKLYFSIMFSVLVVISFGVSAFVLLHKSETKDKLKLTALYLLINLALLCLDIVIIHQVWDLNIYSNLMYVSNMNIYLGVYSLYVLFMTLLSIYGILKSMLISDRDTAKKESKKN